MTAPKRKQTLGQSRQKKRELRDLREERQNLLSEQSDFFVREAYKTLRTNVMFSLAGEAKSQVILVTSSYQGEGKSFTATNLALSFAMADKKVLLIDCDLRRPKLYRLLELRSAVGLSNLLLDPDRMEEAIVSTSEPNLKVVLAGDIPPNPSELLGSRKMQAFLQTMRQRFDYIILDTSPVNMVTDAAVLASQSDGVLFVVRAGRSERGSVVRALDQLRYANAKVLGFVLNGVENMGIMHGKYKYRGEYRYYGQRYESIGRSSGHGV